MLCQEKLTKGIQTAWDENLRQIAEIKGIADKAGVPFLLVIMPFAFQVPEPEKYGQPQELLNQFSAEHEIDCIDMLPYFSCFHRKNPGIPLFVDQSHFCIEGHRLAAEVLAEPVRKLCKGEKDWRPVSPESFNFTRTLGSRESVK